MQLDYETSREQFTASVELKVVIWNSLCVIVEAPIGQRPLRAPLIQEDREGGECPSIFIRGDQ
jgi:hypothetical protein